MADFSLKTNFSVDGESYLLSTVKLHWYSHFAYETMLFKINRKNKVSYKDLYCQQYHTQQEAEEGHKELLLRVKYGERFWEND